MIYEHSKYLVFNDIVLYFLGFVLINQIYTHGSKMTHLCKCDKTKRI